MEDEKILRDFGLTEYEIKAYISLLKLGIATADQISSLGNIPLPRVYDTLTELQKKGFVLISKGRPKKFRPQKPQKAINNLIELKKNNFDKNIKEMKTDSKKIISLLSEISPEIMREKKKEVWFTEKRSNIRNILDEQKGMAKDEVLIFSGDLSWLSENINAIKYIIKSGIKIKAIAGNPKNKLLEKNINLAKKIGISVRSGYNGLLRGHIVDGKLISIAIKTSTNDTGIDSYGKPSSDSRDEYELITSNNNILVETLKENFNFWWEKLK
ncbi:MAG: helix-turn-helix domain-containing protein [Candidatus Aenigmatarchaeota archaeon]